MNIINLSNLGQKPKFGDKVRCEYEDGTFSEYTHCQVDETPEFIVESKKEQERQWRNIELQNTDFILHLTDHPKHSAYMTYRQELRDYPSQADFPNGERPVKP